MSTSKRPKFRSVYRKKRPKRFMTRKESVPAPQPPIPVIPSSASGRKLGMSPSSPGTDTSQGPTSGEPVPSKGQVSGYHYINVETLAKSLEDVAKCGTCGSSLTLKEDTLVMRGLVYRLPIQSKKLECPMISYVSDPYNEEARVLNTLCSRHEDGWVRPISVGNVLCHHQHTVSCLTSLLLEA